MKFKYLSTPIFYSNNLPHVGHLYTTLIADVCSKAMKLFNKKHFFLTGLDEHGQKVAQAATAQGYGYQEHVDKLSQQFEKFFKSFDIQWDFWIRTTSAEHKKAVQHFWLILKNNGYIYKGNYSGWYSISDEAYLTQEPEEKNNIVWREEECYYFKLSKLEAQLKKFYADNPNIIYPKTRYKEVLGFLNQGLKDFVISRPKERLSWGVDVPDDQDHVVYVWVDALVNYLSAIGYPDESYKNYWPGTHILGKDILKFHAIYWPAMLMAANLPLMEKLIVHGWWLNDDEKISKSLGNIVPLDQLVKKYQVDGVRYFLLKGVELGDDAHFNETLLSVAVHSDLANKFGNIFLRVLGVIEIKFGGKLPSSLPIVKGPGAQALSNEVEAFKHALEAITKEPELICKYVNMFPKISGAINDYFQNNKIWEIADKTQQAASLLFLMDMIRKVTILAYPIISNTALEIMEFFGYKEASFKYYDCAMPDLFTKDRPKLFPKVILNPKENFK
jgi:methionyl-tRNA synthetase